MATTTAPQNPFDVAFYFANQALFDQLTAPGVNAADVDRQFYAAVARSLTAASAVPPAYALAVGKLREPATHSTGVSGLLAIKAAVDQSISGGGVQAQSSPAPQGSTQQQLAAARAREQQLEAAQAQMVVTVQSAQAEAAQARAEWQRTAQEYDVAQESLRNAEATIARLEKEAASERAERQNNAIEIDTLTEKLAEAQQQRDAAMAAAAAAPTPLQSGSAQPALQSKYDRLYQLTSRLFGDIIMDLEPPMSATKPDATTFFAASRSILNRIAAASAELAALSQPPGASLATVQPAQAAQQQQKQPVPLPLASGAPKTKAPAPPVDTAAAAAASGSPTEDDALLLDIIARSPGGKVAAVNDFYAKLSPKERAAAERTGAEWARRFEANVRQEFLANRALQDNDMWVKTLLHTEWMKMRPAQRALIAQSAAFRAKIGVAYNDLQLRMSDVLYNYLKGLYDRQQKAFGPQGSAKGEFEVTDFAKITALIGDTADDDSAPKASPDAPQHIDHASDEHYRRLMAEPVSGIAVAVAPAATAVDQQPTRAEHTAAATTTLGDSDDEDAARRVSLLWQD
jgi:hypothetical protein